ncbi:MULTISPECIES: Dps family protein [Priestia]|jgi:starvation-inducible DNA-binding protein|uniref:DNA-protecting protein n=5 Tax=Priestia TaxID=2800373 RepID=D5DUI4_PRIM1|nr:MULTISPECIES: Dps family protein [Priestia]AVX10738.1 DNA starvation/stationary phase protection protein [Bacillus sp. Y-01]KOP76806.1 general stress protein [Bacillus sp. FJAT-21351]KRD89069.1 DNA starvation/stationary phase protection protein [Bacillus sp. Root147]KRD93790.1 DNA starvation/stationary phase protection protein [Bacillus sp. Root239]KRF58110.1 DNA starvation/stationary phase protection protein [Bacillus sp. Soil531]MBK0007557.1 DNA starvation/stationary phase protection pro
MAANVNEIVNKQVANFSVMYIKLHNFHWYVKGEQFFTLHEKFEELYTETATIIDDLAERLLALEGKPVATMKESLELSSIKEADGSETAKDMVASLVSDFDTLTAELKEGMDAAGEAGDETTGDMLLAIHQSLEKHTWMLKSFLGK